MIESISVLKDEASTAIYGDKAKHGVILITLKEKDVQNVLSLSASDPEDGVKVVGVVKDHLDKPLAGHLYLFREPSREQCLMLMDVLFFWLPRTLCSVFHIRA